MQRNSIRSDFWLVIAKKMINILILNCVNAVLSGIISPKPGKK